MMAWRRPGNTPLSEPMMVCLLRHICVTQPHWVNTLRVRQNGCHFVEQIFICISLVIPMHAVQSIECTVDMWIVATICDGLVAGYNLLWPSDSKWWHRSGSTLAQVMAWCPTAPSHYLNQCWLIIKSVLWHSLESNFTKSAHKLNPFVRRLHF